MRYRYPFVEAANASWAARRFGAEVRQTDGRVDVQDRYFFVTVPEHVLPESISLLYLFTYDQVQDASGKVVRRVDPRELNVA
jgi:hypothetical protein